MTCCAQTAKSLQALFRLACDNGLQRAECVAHVVFHVFSAVHATTRRAVPSPHALCERESVGRLVV